MSDKALKEDIERIKTWAEETPYEGMNEHKKTSAIIYFITDGEYVKIGVTTDLNKRLRGLQTGNPRRLKVLYSFTTDWPYTVESKLHKKYENKNVGNEWFDILDDFPLYKDKYLRPIDIETILGASHTFVNKLINKPEFPSIRFGERIIRVKISDLNEYLHTHNIVYKGERVILDNKPLSLKDN